MSVVLDIVLALVLLAYAARGWRVGFARSVGALAGVVAGGFAAAALAPLVPAVVHDRTGAVVATIAAVVVLLLAGYVIGSRIGGLIGGPIRRSPLGPVDRVLGAGTQLAVSALALSIVAGLAVSLGLPAAAAQPVAGSVVLHTISSATPAPVEQALGMLGSSVVGDAAALHLGQQ